MSDIARMEAELIKMGEQSLRAARSLALLSAEEKVKVLNSMADAVENAIPEVLAANALDMENARKNNLSSAMQDRLMLDEKRVRAMAQGLRDVAGQADPAGKVIAEFTRPNGIKISKIAVPLGVIGIIYEARPNVTVDAAGICLKAGNSVILKGGKEAINSNKAIADVMTLHNETIDDSQPYEIFDPIHTWKRKTVTNFTARKLLVKIFENGEKIAQLPTLSEIREYCKEQVETIWDEVKRFENPHTYYVDLSPKLWRVKHSLLEEYSK